MPRIRRRDIRADDGMADVGAVEADDQRAGAGEARAPARQPVVGVDEVEGRLLAEQAAQAPGRRDVLARAGREAEDLDLDPAPADLLDLVAHPAPALGGARVGHEVGDDEDAHPAERIRGGCGTQGSANWRSRVWIGDVEAGRASLETNDWEARR